MRSCCESCSSWWTDCLERYNKPMTAREYLRLNAWQKWQLFRRPPWKFIINLIIVILATAQVILLNTYFAPFNRANVATWNYLLTPWSNPSGDEFGPVTTYHFYQVPDLVGHVKQTLEVYYGLRSSSVDYFEFFYQDADPNQPYPVNLAVTTYKQGPSIFDLTKSFDDDKVTTNYVLASADDLGPFDEARDDQRGGHELNTYVHYIYGMDIDFNVRNYEFAGSTRLCYKWNVNVNYDFSIRGRIDMNINTKNELCPEEKRVPWYNRAMKVEIVLYIALAIFAALSQVLHLKAIYRSIIIFKEARAATYDKNPSNTSSNNDSSNASITDEHSALIGTEASVNAVMHGNGSGDTQEDPLLSGGQVSDAHNTTNNASSNTPHISSWSQLSLRDKLRFFNMWFVIATIGNLCNIIGPLLSLHSQIMLKSSVTKLYFLGLGCMMAWINVVQYFEGASSYYVLITTLRKGTPRVARFLIGVLPVFLGYAMFGVSFFASASEKFATIDKACVTLFSLLNGDVVHDIFDDLYPIHPVISRIYLYTFICLFIYAVLNIFIAIIEDAFFASKAFQLHGQPELEDREKDDQVDPLLLLEFEGMFGDGDSSSSSTSSSSSSSSSSSDTEKDHRNSPKRSSKSRGIIQPTAERRDVVDKNTGGKNKEKKEEEEEEELEGTLISDLAGPTAAAPTDKKSHYRHKNSSSSKTTTKEKTREHRSESTSSNQFNDVWNTLPQTTGSVNTTSTSQPQQDGFFSLTETTPNTDGNTNTSTANNTTSPEVMKMLQHVQESLNVDLAAKFSAMLNTNQIQSKSLRPPHHPSFYPCQWSDCVYCILRGVAMKTMNEAQRQLQAVFDDASANESNTNAKDKHA